MELCYAAASAHNRMITDFCAIDRRLLVVACDVLEDFDRAIAAAREAVRLGAKALMVPSLCPRRHAPSHVALDPVWAIAQEAGVPVVLHVGGEEKMNPVYKENGLPPGARFPRRRRRQLHVGQLHADPECRDETLAPIFMVRSTASPT